MLLDSAENSRAKPKPSYHVSMGQSASFPSDVKVVVVGGGYGGSTLALALLKAGANFTLIDCKPVFHHNVASVRAAVVPGECQIDWKKCELPYDYYR